MAMMNIDLDKLGRLTESDLEDQQERKRLVQYLYQLSEQLKYFQYNLEADNFSADMQVVMKKLQALADAVVELNEEGEPEVTPIINPSEITGANVKMSGTTSAQVIGGSQVSVQSGGDMSVQAMDALGLSADELTVTGYTLLQLLGLGVLKIDGASADSFIRLANAASGAAFMVNGRGTLTTRCGNFDELYVEGQDLPTILEAYRDRRLQVSDTQPEGTDIVWVKPTIPTGKERSIFYTGTSSDGTMMNHQSTTRTVTCQRSDTPLVAAEVRYGIGFRVYNTGETTDHLSRTTVTIRGTDYNGNSVTLGIIDESFSHGEYVVPAGDYVDYRANAYRTPMTTNLTWGNTMTITLTLQFEQAGSRQLQVKSFQIKCNGIESSGYSDGDPIPCEVYYIPEPTEQSGT